MRKRFTRILAALALLVFMTPTLAGWGQTTVTWPGTTALPSTATAVNNDQNITIKTSSTNSYTNPIRIYANTKVTINAINGVKITSIVYEASSTGNYVTYAQNATVSPSVTPTVSGKRVTWTYDESDNVTEFTFTPSTQTRSNGISITYTGGGGGTTTAAPSISGDTPFLNNTTVTITNDASATGANIYYTLNGDAPTTTTTATCFAYSEPFSITATTTVKAIAKKSTDTNASSVVTKTFTKITPLANIAALTANTNTSSEDYYVTLTNAKVTYTNGNYAYIQDASGAVVMYKSNHGLSAGNTFNGTATITYLLRNGNPQITNIAGVTPTTGDAPTSTTVPASAWNYSFDNVLNQWFTITDATITKSNNKYYVSVGSANAVESLQLYGQGDASNINNSNLDENAVYTVVGFPTKYVKDNTTTKELQVFVMPVAADINIESSGLQLSYEEDYDGSITVSYSNYEPEIASATLYSDEDCTELFPTTGAEAWIVLDNMSTTTAIPYIVTENEGTENRTVYMKVSAATDHSDIEKVFTITQVFHQTYSVTYKANGGTGDDVVDSPYDYNATVTVKPNNGTGTNPGFSKTGYDFQNWNTVANGSGTSYDPADNEHNTFNITANTNLFAQWQAHPYALNKTAMTNGNVSFKVNTTTVAQATIGQTVTIVVAPASGYKLSTLTVTNDATPSSPVTVTNNTFTMPASSVTVSATFEIKYSYDIDFESAANTYNNWTFTNMTSAVASDSDVTAHGGSKFGTTGGYSTASITTNSKIATPISLTCYVSKKSTNTTASSWKIQVSSNGSTWNDVGNAQSATSMNKGEWVEFTRDLSSYSNVYVRVCYGSNTAVRCIDDLSLEYTPAQEYTLTVASVANIDIKATVGSTDVTESHTLDVEAAKTVNLTVVSEDDNYQFDDWVVYKTGDESTTVTVTNNSFTMPEYHVTVSATTKEVRTITYSVNGTTSSTIYDKGTVVSLTAPTSGVPAKYTFVGWTADPANTADGDLVTSYTANENATFYAVFKKSNSITLSGDDFGSYDTSEAEATMQGLTWGRYYVMKNGGIQFKKDNQGYFYNKTPIENLSTIIATRKSGTTNLVTIKVGNSQNPSTESALSPSSTSGLVDTYTISGNEYVHIQNLTNATPVYTSFEFCFTGDNTRYTRVFPDNTPATEDITITGPTIITSGSVLDMDSYTLTCNDASKLIIEDGGQLIFSTPAKAAAVKATLKKEITGFGNTNTVQTGWYTIASPLTANYTPAGDMLANTYDLYYYDEEGMIWLNYKQEGASHNHFDMIPEKGYLYANSTNTTLSFAGDVLASDATVTKALSYEAIDDNVKGFNLMGNPFTCNISGNVKIGEADFSAYYIADGTVTGGKNLIPCTLGDREIKPCEGFIVQTDASQNLVFNPADQEKRGETTNKQSFIRIEAGNSDFMDRAYIQMGNVNSLRKMSLNNETSQVSVINDGKEYAAAVIAEAVGEMPVNFKAAEDGQYTITVNSEGVEVGYLHLIDNIAGTDIDLLANPSYTFNAKSDDYESRFRLVFSTTMVNAEMGEDFAFISDGQLVIANVGEAILQVIDVTGRVVAIENINGTCSKAINAKAGVYVLRLINGTDVKTQKMVIR